MMVLHQAKQNPRPDFEIAAIVASLTFLGTIAAFSVGLVLHAKCEVDRRSFQREIHETAEDVFPSHGLEGGVGTASATAPDDREAR